MSNEIVIFFTILALSFLAFVSLSPKRQSAHARMAEGLGSKFLVENFEDGLPSFKRSFIGWLPASGFAIVNGLGKVAETENAILLQNQTIGLGGRSRYCIPKTEVIYEGRRFIVSAFMTFDVLRIRGESNGKLLVKAGCLRF